MLWSGVVEIVRATLFVLAHWCGGSFGAAIVLVPAVVTLVVLSHLSAGVAVYSVSNSLIAATELRLALRFVNAPRHTRA